MELLIVRHGESVANAEGRMQGQRDYPLSDLGQRQASALARFLSGAGYRFDACYTSPLTRARSTALALTTALGLPEAELEPSLAELHAGSLQGLTRAEIAEQHPSFMQRGLKGLGDFAEYGGESYEDVQRRVQQLIERWHHRHLVDAHRVLAVAHGGVNFQLLKTLVCDPVPRVMSVKFGNCCATLVRVRERRGVYLGELIFHLPVDLLGAPTSEGMVGVF
ncbi:MAG: histidine phosphatase family protein [Myxococcales bacterium]|nr:MAG: histidine phosphatase family protein [Myxococcales bacterium]